MTNLSGTDLHLPEECRTGKPGMKMDTAIPFLEKSFRPRKAQKARKFSKEIPKAVGHNP